MRSDGARRRRHPRLGPAAVRAGVRRGGAGRGAVRLPLLRRLVGRAAPVGRPPPASRGLPCGGGVRPRPRPGGPRAHRALGDVVVRGPRGLRRRRRPAHRGGDRADPRPRRHSHPGVARPPGGPAGDAGWHARCDRGRDRGRPGRGSADDPAGRAARRGRGDEHRGGPFGLRGDRRPELAERDHRPRRPAGGPQPADHEDLRALMPDPDPGRRARLHRSRPAPPRPPPGGRRAARRCAPTPAPTSTSTSASGASARSRTRSTSCAATWASPGRSDGAGAPQRARAES